MSNKAKNQILTRFCRIKPRERAMPLVPQPFLEGSRSRHPVFRGERPTAASFGKFCPNLDTTQYRESLSEKKKTELDQRAAKLCKRATCNQVYKASEFCWEVSAWKDVFGLLYDDERFLMLVFFLFILVKLNLRFIKPEACL